MKELIKCKEGVNLIEPCTGGDCPTCPIKKQQEELKALLKDKQP